VEGCAFCGKRRFNELRFEFSGFGEAKERRFEFQVSSFGKASSRAATLLSLGSESALVFTQTKQHINQKRQEPAPVWLLPKLET
jgi:hypothetical protein